MMKFIDCRNGFAELSEQTPDCWVNVECPDRSEFVYLLDRLHIPEDFLHDINDPDERPRTEMEGSLMLTILRIPMRAGRKDVPFVTVPIGIITGPGLTVSVCYHPTEILSDFLDHVRSKSVIASSQSDLILHIINSSAYWFLRYLREMNQEVNAAEDDLERTVRNSDLLRLMKLQKSMVYFSTSIGGNRMMINHLKKRFAESSPLDPDLLEDVEIELRQASETVDIYSRILTSTMDAFASVISNNVNAIMKRMTAISITLMIPTLIASFYGMNVASPGSSLPGAFIGIVVISLLLSVGSVVLFRRLRWF